MKQIVSRGVIVQGRLDSLRDTRPAAKLQSGWLRPELAQVPRLGKGMTVWVGQLPRHVRVLSAWLDLRPGRYSDLEYEKYLGKNFQKPTAEAQTTNGVFCVDHAGRTVNSVPSNVKFTLGVVAQPNHSSGYVPLAQYAVSDAQDRDRLFHWRPQMAPHQRVQGYPRDVVLTLECPDDLRLIGCVEWGLHIEDSSESFIV